MQRVGRYDEAADANRKGAAADEAYVRKTHPPDYYPMYFAHNLQFLAYATAMEGRKAETLAAMKQMRETFPESAMLAMPGTDWYFAEPYMAMVRFGMWKELLTEPRPHASLQAMTGGYLFAQASALAATGRVAEAQRVLQELDSLRSSVPADAPAGLNVAPDVLALASMMAQASIESAGQHRDAAIATLTRAVAAEDRLAYDEPADWFFPVRHVLGAELLKAGRAAQAEAVYREDLQRNPQNGWSLFGLAQALRAQHKTVEAAQVQARFNEAWKRADIQLSSSIA
jgi:tetratricopeptide (TPR) repeat protein